MHDHSHELGRISGAGLPSMEGGCVLEGIHSSLSCEYGIVLPCAATSTVLIRPDHLPRSQCNISTLTRKMIAWNGGYPLDRLILLLGPGSTLPLSLSGHGELD